MMKKVLLFTVGCMVLSLQAQLLNPGFELKRSDGNPSFWGSIIPLPVVIGDTVNRCKIDSAFYFTSKDAHSGNTAIELRNAQCGKSTHVAGLVHNMSTDTSYFASGEAYNLRPAYYTFWYKFISVGNDTAATHVSLIDENSGNTLVDQWVYLPAQTNYTPVSVFLNYESAETPTSVAISFFTETEPNASHYGSRLLVDDVEFRNFPLSVSNLDQKVLVFPNPAAGFIQFHTQNMNGSALKIYGVNGAIYLQKSFTNSTQINTEDLANGVYFYEIVSENGVKNNGKFLVQK